MNAPKFLTTLLGLLAATPSAFADFPGAVVTDAPLVYYRFEEDPGATTLADSSGNGQDIDYSSPLGLSTLGADAAVGKGILFVGDDSILTPLLLDPTIGDFTIEAVIKPDSTAGGGVAISNLDGDFGTGRSNFLVNANQVYTSFSGGATTNSGIVVSQDNFDHVVLTYDQSASLNAGTPTFRFYVNGVAAGTSEVIPESANGNWVLGSNKNQTSQFFSGTLDEVAIYDKRLDDPDGDGDEADSRVGDHFKEYLADTETLVQFSSDFVYRDSGQNAELTWSVSPALTSLTIDDGTGPVDVLPDTADCLGGQTVSPTTTTTYTLTGVGPLGTETLEVTIVVDEPAVIDLFSSDVESIPEGGIVTLTWGVTNGVTVEIDNEVGMIDPVSGSIEVSVDEDTTFTLSATNSQGTVTDTVMIEVIALPEPGLVAHWRVGETAGETDGTTLISETGELSNGIFVGTPTFDTSDPAPASGGSTASIVFDGFGSWVEVANFTGIGGSMPRTLAFWFKGDAAQTNPNATLIGWGTGGTTNRFDTRLNTAGLGEIRTEVAGSGSNGTTTIGDNVWHHCAVVIDPTIGTTIGDVQFYIDGVLDSLTAVGGTEVNTTTTNPVLIGASPGIANRSLTGKMDDIRIYNRALTIDEIAKLASPFTAPLEITGITRRDDGTAQISWSGAPGDYIFEYSLDLSLGSWIELSDSETIDDGETSSNSLDTTIAPANEKVFYRFRVEE